MFWDTNKHMHPLDETRWSAGAITFVGERGSFRYLLLRRNNGESWDFPIGKKSAEDKSPEDTARREVNEETGLDVEILKGFRYASHYSQYTWAAYEGRVFLFLARTEELNVQLGEQTEHDLFAWLSLQEAIDRISFPSSRSALLKAHEFLILRSPRRTSVKRPRDVNQRE